jgi:lysophospholipase L1-like esterase
MIRASQGVLAVKKTNSPTRSAVHQFVRCLAVFSLMAAAYAADSPQAAVPTLFIASDSTASVYSENPKRQQGWGAVLQPYFDEHRLVVNDVARGGRSSRTFVSEGHWDKMLADLKQGDFVIIQFGHNDQGAVNEEPPGSTRPPRARGSIPGTGDESQEIDNVITGKHETVYSFGWYLRKMVSDVRGKGATPILVTFTKANYWKDGRIECASNTYRKWTWETAQTEHAAFVDLLRINADRYQKEGQEKVKALFIDDPVHTNIDGATANAEDVVSGLATLKNLPFRKMLSNEGSKIAADRGPPKDSACPPLG